MTIYDQPIESHLAATHLPFWSSQLSVAVRVLGRTVIYAAGSFGPDVPPGQKMAKDEPQQVQYKCSMCATQDVSLSVPLHVRIIIIWLVVRWFQPL